MLASMPESSPIRPQEPIKRRRGRPPKNNKLPDAFPTLTLQFQTSPDSGSPTAESNSNMMVKMGEPDAFTPLMKVSPSNPSRKRRRRSNHHSDIDDLPSKRSVVSQSNELSEDPLLTPMSLSLATAPSLYVNAKTVDSLSQIVKGSKLLGANYSLATPPKMAALDRFGSSLAKSAGPAAQKESLNNGPKKDTVLKDDQAGLVSYIDDDTFLFQLVVDEKGKAVLSNKQKSKSTSDEIFVDAQFDPSRPSALVHSAAIDVGALHSLRDDEKRKLEKPTLPSYATLLAALETDSLPEKHIVPQTPQNNSHSFSETPIYLQTDSNGPGSDLAFNLTPQFNAMMYLMMSINSPQQKRSMSQQQPFLNPQLDLNQYNRLNGGQAHAIDTSELLGLVTSPKSSFSDEGDARAALRKAFNRGK